MKNFEIKNNLIYFADSIPREAADYIINRFDNYYYANGLADVGISSDDETTNRSVEIIWNLSKKQPTLEEIVKQFETWYEIWKGGVRCAIEAANES